MKRYFITAIIVFGMFFCAATALAETTEWASLDSEGNLTVNIVSDLSEDELYTIYLTEQDTVLSSETGESRINGLIRLEQTTLSKQEGKRYCNTALNISMPFAADGKIYKTTIGGGELDGETFTVVYPIKATADKAASAIFAADAKTIGNVLKEYQNKAWVVDLNDEVYRNYGSEVNSRLSGIVKENGAAAEKTDIYFESACAITELAHCSETEFYDKLLKNEYICNLTLTDEIYSEKENIAKAFVNLRSGSQLNNLTDLKNLLHKSEALGVLNDSTRENVLDVLKTYNDVFNLDFNGDYKKADSYSVLKKMAAGNPYKSINAVKTAFNEAVASAVSSNNDTSFGSSGGGSGSSGGGGSYKPAVNGDVILPTNNFVTVDMVEGLTGTQEGFKDISEAKWAENYINYLRSKNIIVGDGNGYVRPNEAIRREEFVKILVEAVKPSVTDEETENETVFDDVNDNEWYASYINTAVRSGIVKGISEKAFGTGMEITRQDAAAMIYRAIEARSKVLKETTDGTDFIDEKDISDYALNSVKTMQRAGVIAGYETGEFLPKKSVTRAETAKMIYSVLSNINEL